MNLWSKQDYPHKGWEPMGVADFGEDYQHCDMCNNYPVRWVHKLHHAETGLTVEVGCVCAEKLAYDYDAQGYEQELKRNQRREARRLKRLTERNAHNIRRKSMALITPDLSEAQKTLEPGVYPARIIAADAVESKAGKPMIKWTLETFDNADPGFNGKRIVTRTMCVGKGVFKLQEMYKAATGEKLEGAFDTEQLIGSEVRVTLVEGRDQHGNPSDWPDVKTVSRYS